MPTYDMICYKKHKTPQYFSFSEFDAVRDGRQFATCGVCDGPAVPVSANLAALYGTMKCHDKAFADAEEATGEKITSTKDIDRLEKAGVIRAVTNPSRARKFKDKQ